MATITTDDVDVDQDDAEDAAETAGRIGLAARGVLYLVSAVLTVQVATGSRTDEGPGSTGALKSVAEQPLGRVLLVVLAVGVAAHALWRFAEAATMDPDPDGSTWENRLRRIGYAGRGLIYLAILVPAVSLVVSGSSSSSGSGGGSGSEGEKTEMLFGLPGGRWIVLAVGVGVLCAGFYNLYKAVSLDYRDEWEDRIDEEERTFATVVSTAGLLGHMLVFLLVGFFLTRAGITYDPDEPESLDQAARAVADATWGTELLFVLAVGMVAYAGFSFIQARWRRLLD